MTQTVTFITQIPSLLKTHSLGAAVPGHVLDDLRREDAGDGSGADQGSGTEFLDDFALKEEQVEEQLKEQSQCPVSIALP